MSDEKVFVDGLIVKRNDKAPDFVVCNLSVKVSELTKFLEQHQSNGWVNIQCKQSKGGKLYAELDTWRPTQGDSARAGVANAQAVLDAPSEPAGGDWDQDIPF